MSKAKNSQTLAQKIIAFFKLGEEGKIQSFFDRELKKLLKLIAGYNRKIGNFTYNYEQTCDDLKDQLEDAESSLEQAYLAVVPENVATNSEQDDFSVIYWGNITNAENKIELLNEKLTREKDDYDEAVKMMQEKIDDTQARIDVIVGK